MSKKTGGKKNRRKGKRGKVIGGMIRHFESLSKSKFKAKNTGEKHESVPKIIKLTRLMKRSITNI